MTTLRSCILVVDDTVDSKDNKMEETMDVGDIMIYHFSLNYRSSNPPCWSPSNPSPPC